MSSPRAETYDEVVDVITQALPQHADDFIANLAPSIRFRNESDGRSQELARAPMQLGGGARLPVDFEWPRHGQRPMHLIAIVDFEQIAEFDDSERLPVAGLLHFFYDPRGGWGGEPTDRTSWHLVMLDSEACDHGAQRFKPAHVEDADWCYGEFLSELYLSQPYVQWTAPNWDEDCVGESEWPDRNDEDVKRGVWTLMEIGSGDPPAPSEQLLGWCETGGMQLQCELVTNNVVNTGPWDDNPLEEPCRAGAADWTLLLHISSWDEPTAMWGGGVGTLNVWIRAADLRARRFNRAWMLLDSG